ncbi:hypothetical protein [Streptococcus australis]|uniref:Enoyl-CoA hydratase n=1 Tax=Streptococcus australis TaxID=113107 RepID=A0A4V0C1Y3_9STRE|nr:hypothetical protein [Streptococcus australis]VTS73131.1 Uncharacterised protein [Streptococcus australis]
MKRRKWLLAGMVLSFVILLVISLSKGLTCKGNPRCHGVQDFQKGSLPFIQTNDIASVLLIEKERNGE